jgi:hypothetical protein
MGGIATARCPECGSEAKRERDLLRTRRRWRWIAAGILLMGASFAAGAINIVRTRGWMGLVPSTALICMPIEHDALVGANTVPIELKGRGLITATLGLRIRLEEVWEWQCRVVAWRLERSWERRGMRIKDGGDAQLLERLDAIRIDLSSERISIQELLGTIRAGGIEVYVEVPDDRLDQFLRSEVGVGPWKSAVQALDDTFGGVFRRAPSVSARWFGDGAQVRISQRRARANSDAAMAFHDVRDLVDREMNAAEEAERAHTKVVTPSFGPLRQSERSIARDRVFRAIQAISPDFWVTKSWLGDHLFVRGNSFDLDRVKWGIQKLRAAEPEGR